MADVIFQGWHEAQKAGVLTATPRVQLVLCMGSFSGATEEDSVHVDDLTTVDEFDGIGYARVDQTATWSYDTATDEMRLVLVADEFNASGEVVTPGSDDIIGLLVRLYVDGTDAGDYVLGYTTSGGFPFNGANSAIAFTPPATGLMFQRAA